MNHFRAFSLAIFVLTAGAIWQPVPFLGGHCAGALLAMEQGNPGHKEPAPGWYCYQPPPKGLDDHACSCHRECAENEQGQTVIQEDPNCRVYCYMDHCACPKHNCP